MRTQSSFRSLRSANFSSRKPYICSTCRESLARYSTARPFQPNRGPTKVSRRLRPDTETSWSRGPVRWLNSKSQSREQSGGSSSNARSSDAKPGVSLEEDILQTTDGHAVDGRLSSGNKSSHPSVEGIRSRLRKWSVEQSRLAGESGRSEAVFGALPPNNSLLIDQIERAEIEDIFNTNQEHDEDEEGAGVVQNQLGLEPGDAFYAKLKGIHPQFAVFLGLRQGRKAEVLLRDGRWALALTHYPNQVILPEFAQPHEISLLRACVTEHPNFKRAEDADPKDKSHESVVGDLPVALTTSLTHRLQNLSEEALSFQRDNAKTLDDLYTQFADEDKFLSHRFSALVKIAFNQNVEELSMGARYAIFSSLRKSEGKHTIMRSKSSVIEVFFTPKSLYKQVVQVMTWAREYQDCAARAAMGNDVSAELRANPLNSFINKARRIILKSRKIRAPTTIGSLGPSGQNRLNADGSVVTRETGETITKDDLSIIEFMWNTYLRLPRAYDDLSALSVGALILRAIGAYPKMQLNLQIARLFFREMGLMAPWSEAMDDDLRIPAPGRRGAAKAQQWINHTDALARKHGFTSDRFKIPLPDEMASLRKDWGSDMTVYCIDKRTTSVLDDGISLEDSDVVPGATWLHVHVAHPSAFLISNGGYAQRARALTAAIYTSAKFYAMWPEDIVNALSLKPDAPVMTISSLLLNGQVLDIKVSVGIIRQVVRLQPDEVDEVLGKATPETAVLQVGPTIGNSQNFDMSDYQDAKIHASFIHKLESLVQARLKARREEIPDYPKWRVLSPQVRDNVSWTEPFDGDRHSRSYHYLGDPTIRITAPRHQLVQSSDASWESSTDLTAHAMVLAGESIGKWFKDRNIPVVFNGAVPVDESSTVSQLNAREIDDPLHDLHPRKYVSSSPVPHVLMGMAQYVRATSPLRRYGDNIAQWQADAYLKAESEGRLSASGDFLPFTKEEIDDFILEGSNTTSVLDLSKRRATVHWNMQAIFRAFHFNEAPLPAIWDAQITQPDFEIKRGTDDLQESGEIADLVGFLQPFFLRTLFLKSKEGWETGVERFQYLPVKIEYVDTTEPNVYVRAVGPPSWTPTQNGAMYLVKPENEITAQS